jgi:predicted RNA-binding Zn-ribbon protein involved in translation (DUF1610 family)
MAFVSTKCIACGANLEIDDTQDSAVCKYCGAAFIAEKAVNNYNINIYLEDSDDSDDSESSISDSIKEILKQRPKEAIKPEKNWSWFRKMITISIVIIVVGLVLAVINVALDTNSGPGGGILMCIFGVCCVGLAFKIIK